MPTPGLTPYAIPSTFFPPCAPCALRGEPQKPSTQHFFFTTFSLFLKIWSLNYFDFVQLSASIRATEFYLGLTPPARILGLP